MNRFQLFALLEYTLQILQLFITSSIFFLFNNGMKPNSFLLQGEYLLFN